MKLVFKLLFGLIAILTGIIGLSFSAALLKEIDPDNKSEVLTCILFFLISVAIPIFLLHLAFFGMPGRKKQNNITSKDE